MLRRRAVHAHHDVLPGLLVAGDVVLVHLHRDQTWVWPQVLWRVQPVLRKVYAADEGDLAIEGVRLDVGKVVHRCHEPPPGVQHQMQVLVVLPRSEEQLLKLGVLVVVQVLLRRRIVPAQYPDVHAALDGPHHKVVQRLVRGLPFHRAEDLEPRPDEEGHDDDLLLGQLKLPVDLRVEVAPAIRRGGVARHRLKALSQTPRARCPGRGQQRQQ
mmetsp:Transcript_100303/g.312541  ORF Transcript_100303/g.312541 Transcript_100303/m.312541 type:complete len:213 (+) Transcript_100303:1684-2322(+)